MLELLRKLFFAGGLVRYPQAAGVQHLVRTSLMMPHEAAISNFFQKMAPYGWRFWLYAVMQSLSP